MRNRREGFTLVELLVVIAVIVILMSMAFYAMNAVYGSTYKTQAQDTVNRFRNAVEAYKSDHKSYPSEHRYQFIAYFDRSGAGPNVIEELGSLFSYLPEFLNKGDAGATGATSYRDPWGGPYHYDILGAATDRSDPTISGLEDDVDYTLGLRGDVTGTMCDRAWWYENYDSKDRVKVFSPGANNSAAKDPELFIHNK